MVQLLVHVAKLRYKPKEDFEALLPDNISWHNSLFNNIYSRTILSQTEKSDFQIYLRKLYMDEFGKNFESEKDIIDTDELQKANNVLNDSILLFKLQKKNDDIKRSIRLSLNYNLINIIKLHLSDNKSKFIKACQTQYFLHSAIESCDINIIELMLKKDQQILEIEKDSKSPLQVAVMSNRQDVVRLILSYKENIDYLDINTKDSLVNLRDENGRTLLHNAALNKEFNPKLCNILLNANASRILKDYDDQTPLDLAKTYGHEDILKFMNSWNPSIVYVIYMFLFVYQFKHIF